MELQWAKLLVSRNLFSLTPTGCNVALHKLATSRPKAYLTGYTARLLRSAEELPEVPRVSATSNNVAKREAPKKDLGSSSAG